MQGLLSTQSHCLGVSSTAKESFTEPVKCPVRTVGIKQEQLHHNLYKLANEEHIVERSLPPVTPDYVSVTKGDYSKGMISAVLHVQLTHFT